MSESSVESMDFKQSRIGPKETFEFVLNARNFEITNFWQRSNYFLVLNSGLAVGLFNVQETAYVLALAILGVIVSILWFNVTLGSKFWQIHWESKLFDLEKRYLEKGILDPGLRLFSQTPEEVKKEVESTLKLEEHGWLARKVDGFILKKPSVTFAMTSLSVIFFVAWLFFLGSAIVIKSPAEGPIATPPENHDKCVFHTIPGWDGVYGCRDKPSGDRGQDGDRRVGQSESLGGSLIGTVSLLVWVAIIAVSGVWLLLRSSYPAGRFTGGLILAVMSLFSGAKIIGIDKLISVDNISLVFNVPRRPLVPPDRVRYSYGFQLSAFDSASTKINEKIACELKELEQILKQSDGLNTVNIVAGADRRELRPNAKREFSSNWALAQQRTISIASELKKFLPQGTSIIVSNAGPSHTAGVVSENMLDQDRAPRIELSGFGDLPKSLSALPFGSSWARSCN